MDVMKLKQALLADLEVAIKEVGTNSFREIFNRLLKQNQNSLFQLPFKVELVGREITSPHSYSYIFPQVLMISGEERGNAFFTLDAEGKIHIEYKFDDSVNRKAIERCGTEIIEEIAAFAEKKTPN